MIKSEENTKMIHEILSFNKRKTELKYRSKFGLLFKVGPCHYLRSDGGDYKTLIIYFRVNFQFAKIDGNQIITLHAVKMNDKMN